MCKENQLFNQQAYLPEMWTGPKDYIYAAIKAVDDGLSYANECLAQHDASLGRTTRKNKIWAETMESDIRHMTQTLTCLRDFRQLTDIHDHDCAVSLNGRHACSCSLSKKGKES